MLDVILEHKRRELSALPDVGEHELQRCDRDFRAAIAAAGLSFIAEVKRRSPSGGTMAPQVDAVSQASAYVAGGCAAISVLTDERFFGGSFEDLSRVVRMAPVPVLCKDFIIDEKQVRLARRAGASACLLIVAALPDGGLRSLIERVRSFGMSALVEVHDEAEMKRAIAAGAEVLGVNNRDLRTMHVDRTTVQRLSPLVPEHCLLVAESGYDSFDALVRLPRRVNAVLIGSALMRSADPAATLQGWRKNLGSADGRWGTQ